MKAITFHEFGGPSVLRYEDVPDVEPGPGEVAVKVYAAALNHLDADVREGVSRLSVELPHIPGVEVAGTVAAVGPGVDPDRVGQEVLPYTFRTCGRCDYCLTGRDSLCLERGFLQHGYAEYVVVPERQLIELGEATPLAEAAALQAAFGTAWHMLFTRGRLRAGETVLISSVGSGIGSAALQLAKLAGATVIGTASADAKLRRAEEKGLDLGINYCTSDVVEDVMAFTGYRGVDLAFEHVGGTAFEKALTCLRPDGRLVTCGGHAGEVVQLDIVPFFRTQKTIVGSFGYFRSEVRECIRLLAEGKIAPDVHRTFPLSDAATAMTVLEGRNHYGKLLLLP